MNKQRRRWAAAAIGLVLGMAPAVALAGPAAEAGAAGPALTSTPGVLQFGNITLGTFQGPESFIVINTDTSPDSFNWATGITYSGVGAQDYLTVPEEACPLSDPETVTLQGGQSCTLDVIFFPGAVGSRNATLMLNDADDSGVSVSILGEGAIGYYQVDQKGHVANFGDATFLGDTSKLTLNHPIVGITATGDHGGYWLVANDGGIFSFGDAQFFGSTGNIHLNKPIVGMAATPDAGGYWMVASDGGIFAYGDASFFGSTGNINLNKPIVGMASTLDGNGYWLVASDGGIFSFGDAQFYGSTGNISLNKPIVGMAPTPDGNGYWLVASDGGIFSYGDAPFFGSTGAIHLNQPIVGMAAMPDGGGYWFTAADGGLFNYGTAPFSGSSAGQGLGTVVAMATDGEPTVQAQTDTPALRHANIDDLSALLAHTPKFH